MSYVETLQFERFLALLVKPLTVTLHFARFSISILFVSACR